MSMKDFVDTLSSEQKKALMDALTQNNNEPQTNTSDDNNFTVNSKKTTNNRRKEPVKARKNEWVDTGEFRDDETKYGERTPRSRKPFTKVNVECSVCGRSFKADPKYIYGEYHRCSRCTGK